LKRVPPKSFVRPRNTESLSLRYSEIRKDSAVHVSLSSSSLVKQPGVRKPLSLIQGAIRPKPSKEVFSNTSLDDK
jgi:hypothetical protein